jgi:NTP pyrophosphatase (non-canonical NTP hydrolase)
MPPQNPDQDAEAERINNQMRDESDKQQERSKKILDETPKSPEEMLDDERMGRAPSSKKRLEQQVKNKEKAKKEGEKKFEIDLDNYMEFVDRVTSPASKDYNALLARYGELKAAGCKIERLDTAGSGLAAESGEFMEIVKKLKFQGKPYDAKTKEHLEKELGDIIWYAAQAALALNLRLDEVIYTNTLKLASRYPGEMFNVDYSENRAPGDI